MAGPARFPPKVAPQPATPSLASPASVTGKPALAQKTPPAKTSPQAPTPALAPKAKVVNPSTTQLGVTKPKAGTGGVNAAKPSYTKPLYGVTFPPEFAPKPPPAEGIPAILTDKDFIDSGAAAAPLPTLCEDDAGLIGECTDEQLNEAEDDVVISTERSKVTID